MILPKLQRGGVTLTGISEDSFYSEGVIQLGATEPKALSYLFFHNGETEILVFLYAVLVYCS